MLGNVFSPRWARARRGDATVSGLDFSTVNVALRSKAVDRWALTERARESVERSADHLTIGASHLAWCGDDLVATIDERTAPWGSLVRGTVRVTPICNTDRSFDLDPDGLHVWSPRIPLARIEVDLTEPRVRFSGTGYVDANHGRTPLEDTFASWSWSRVSNHRGTAIRYDVTLRDGTERTLALRMRGGALEADHPEPKVLLPSTRFGLVRPIRGEARGDAVPRVVRTLEDGPFYARSMIETTLDGARAHGIHETVSLDRFRSPWVQWLLQFRMRAESP